MKHLFRTVVLFLTLLMTIFGCQQEDLNESQQSSIENGANSLIRVGTLKDFKNLNQYISKDIIDVYNSSLQFRTATEDTNGFTIIGDEITQVTTDSLTTFTLKIVKDNQPPNSFSNLIISFGLDNSNSAFIINYYPTENYMSSIESNPQAVFEGQVSSEYIDYNEDLNGLLGLNRLSCWYIAATFCNWGGEEHLAGGNCTEAFMYSGSQKVCVGSSEYQPERDNSLGGGGGGEETSSIPSTNPKVVEPCEISSNNISGNSINLTELGCDENTSTILIVDEEDPDCIKLKNLTENPIIKTRLKQLKDDNLIVEKGFKITKNHIAGEYQPSPILENNNGTNHINIEVNPYIAAIAHTHTNNVFFKMFSAPDILKMAEMAYKVQSNSDTTVLLTEITHMLVFKNDTGEFKTYALRFDDLESVLALQNIRNNKKKRKRFEKKLRNDYESNVNPVTYAYETDIYIQQRHLFSYLNNYNLNISLYEANYDAYGHVDTWQRINENDLQKEPCD